MTCSACLPARPWPWSWSYPRQRHAALYSCCGVDVGVVVVVAAAAAAAAAGGKLSPMHRRISKRAKVSAEELNEVDPKLSSEP